MTYEAKARYIHTIPAIGRSVAVVICTCGHENRFYLWSWSGHGKAKCKGCRLWIFRSSLLVGSNESVLPEVKEALRLKNSKE